MRRARILLFLLCVAFACQQKSDLEYPAIFTGMVTEINSTGATFMCRITELGQHECIEFGFVWDSLEGPDYKRSEKYIFPTAPKTGDASQRISTTLINGKNYYVKAFVRLQDIIIYGKETRFTSKGSDKPEIDHFFPTHGNLNDTVTIFGKGFSYVAENNQVHFGEYEATLIYSGQDTLQVTVPGELAQKQSSLSVTVGGNKSLSSENFFLIEPEIMNFQPVSAPFGSNITISGNNFHKDVDKLRVRFGDIEAPILHSTESELVVQVPFQLNLQESYLEIDMNNQRAISQDPFSLVLPEIHTVSPTSVSFGSNMVLTGTLLDSNPEYLKVLLAGIQAEVIDMTAGSITFTVPDEMDVRTFTPVLDINGLLINSPEEIHLSDLILDGFQPSTITSGETITINGEGFSPVAMNNMVMIGNVMGTVSNASNTQLEVLIPLQDENIYEQRELNLSVEVIGQTRSFNEPITINDTWFRLADAPVENPYRNIYVQAGGKLYTGLTDNESFWVFDPDDHSWTALSDFPGIPRREGTAFHLDGEIYFGTGQDADNRFVDLWIYDIASNQWNQTEDFPGDPRFGITSFSIGNKAFLIGGTEKYSNPFSSCWEFEPSTNTWVRTSMLEYVGYFHAGAIVIDDIAYYGLGDPSYHNTHYDELVYIFDPNAQDSYWRLIQMFPEERNERPICFSLNGLPYFSVGADFYYYDNEWIPVQTEILSNINGGVGFSENGKAYVGLGNGNTMWEYDPSR